MSRHEGVSCDSCLRSNFRGRRYKCLICYDYDLCATCYEDGAISTRHSSDHPMQCILTRSDFELYYGGEILSQEQPQSFTCPYCKKMGLSDSALLEHVAAEHTDTGLEVVCPVCAALPGGDPNLVTDDFAGHLTLEHRTGPRDLISFLDEPSAIRHGGVRRIPHSGRALGGPRSRRSNMHFSSSGGLSALSPSGRDSVDPIAELLSQLSGVRRGAPQPSQLQQLQMQLQFERQQVSATRQQLERLPRRQAHTSVTSSNSVNNSSSSGNTSTTNTQQQASGLIGSTSINSRDVPTSSTSPLPLVGGTASGNGITPLNQQINSQFLLARFMTPSLDEQEQGQLEKDRADRSQFVQALMVSTLSNLDLFKINDEDNELNKIKALESTDKLSNHGDATEADLEGGDIDDDDHENEFRSQHELENQINQQLGISRSGGLGGGGGGGGGGGCIQKASAKSKQPSNSTKLLLTSGGLVNNNNQQERRSRPPPPTQSKPPRDLKSSNSVSTTKHVPDTRNHNLN